MNSTISTECVLANTLLTHPSVSPDEMGNISQWMAILCPDVYVDLTISGRIAALSCYPQFFRIAGNTIHSTGGLTEEIVDSQFNWHLPKDVIELLREAIRKAVITA